jgi:FkbM family methyltransferase
MRGNMKLALMLESMLQSIGSLSILPPSLTLFLAGKDKRLRYLLPPNQEIEFSRYLGDIRIRANTVYPVELEMLTGQYDRVSSSIIRRFVTEDAFAVDVGANVGPLTLLMAKIVRSGTVIAIEPGPPICERLKRNLRLNPELEKNVRVFQVGVADKAGSLMWSEDQNNRGNAGLLGSVGTPVEVVTLDSIISSIGTERLDFIKIDVEGMEYEVIIGASDSIRKYRPIIYYETLEPFRAFRGFDIYGEIYNRLHELGYHHYFVLGKGKLVKADSLDVLLSANTLAIPAEKASALA